MLEKTKRIKSFKELPVNWNGYGALPIPEEIVNYCLKFLDLLPADMEIYPTGRESMQFEIERNKYYLELEIYKEKFGFLLMYEDTVLIEFETILDLFPDIISFINNIYHHYFNK